MIKNEDSSTKPAFSKIIRKNDIRDLAQLLNSMKDAIKKMEKAKARNDAEQVMAGKKQILDFQKEIEKLL